MLDQLRSLGMDEAEVEKARVEMAAHWGRQSGAFAVHPDNGPALRLFLAMATQWRTTSVSTLKQAMIVRTGLDYGPMKDVAEMAGLGPVDAGMFNRLRVIEAEALGAWQEERERAA